MVSRLAVFASIAVIAGAVASAGNADPTNAGTSSTINVVCGGTSTAVVMNGNGIWSPLHDIASTSVLIPTALNVTLTFTFAAGGPPVVDHAIVTKQGSSPEPVSCTIPLQTVATSPDVSIAIEGTIVGSWTPNPA